MEPNLEFLKLSHQREKGITLGFLLYCYFIIVFKEDKFDRRFAYLLHSSGIIRFKELKKKYLDLNNDNLLQELFYYSKNDKDFKLKQIREITSIKSKDTFRNRFGNYLKNLGLGERRAFTLEETYLILKFWNPELKVDSMRGYLKKELAAIYTKGNYEELAEILIDNGIVPKEEYKNLDKFSPKVANALEKLLNDNIKDEQANNEIFILYLFFFNRIKILL